MSKNRFLFIVLLAIRFAAGQNADLSILKTLNAGHMPCWDATMRGVSFSVYPVMPATAGGIWLHGCINKDPVMKRNGFKSAFTMGLAIGISTGLKYAVNRTRPFAEYPNDIVQRDPDVGPYSFPSGHTTAAFATATAASLTYRKWYVTVPAYAYAAMVGYSRMRLGVHYPTDVLSGALIGIGSGFLIWEVDRMIVKKRKARQGAAETPQ